MSLSHPPQTSTLLAEPGQDVGPLADPSNSSENEKCEASTVFTDDAQLVWFLLSATGPWVVAGILFMLAGIIILRFGLLPRIYTCPPGATCSGSFDPQILLVVQTIMLYWLRIGCLIASLGISKLIAYQGWLLLKTRRQTIGTLELNLAIVDSGGVHKAAQLIWQGRNVALALWVLAQVPVFAVIPLVVTRSISDLQTTGRVKATFEYPGRFAENSTAGALVVLSNAWLLGDNDTYPLDAFLGSFIPRDNRTKFAVDAQPSGPRISGTVSCSVENISTIIIENRATNPSYNFSYGDQSMLVNSTTLSSAFLGSFSENNDVEPSISSDNTTVSFRLFWVTNTTGQLLNSTTTSDGELHYTQCIHTIDIVPIASQGHLDDIKPPEFFVPAERRGNAPRFCAGDDTNLCLKMLIGEAMFFVWAGQSERRSPDPASITLSSKTCQRGALTIAIDHPDDICVVDNESWTEALAIVAEVIKALSIQEGSAVQDLWIRQESISRSQWWLQAIIPCMTLIVYAFSIAYLFVTNRWRAVLKELLLSEVIMASLSEQDIQEYARMGQTIDKLRVGPSSPVDGHGTGTAPSIGSPDDDHRTPHGLPGADLLEESRDQATQNKSTPPCHDNLGSRARQILYLVRATIFPVLGGVFVMFAGIVIVRFFLLPHIYTCPNGATCRHSFDPRGAILRITQVVMLYWLQAGFLISSIGLMKVITYLGWFGMMKEGNMVRTLGLALASTHGSPFKAAVLLFKRKHMVVALLTLFVFAINALVALVIKRSISDLKTVGRVKVTFPYAEEFSMPSMLLPGTGTATDSRFDSRVANGYYEWLMGNNQTHPVDLFSRTLIVRDNRTDIALATQPSGRRVSGTVSCTGQGIFVSGPLVRPNGTLTSTYNITYDNHWKTSSPIAALGSTFLGRPSVQTLDENRTAVVLKMLWLSYKPGMIFNGTTSHDGRLHVAVCSHTIELVPIPDEHLDYILPAKLFLPPNARNGSVPVCASGYQDDLCFARIIADYLYGMWSGFELEGYFAQGRMLGILMWCQRGALSHFLSPEHTLCPVDTQAWTLNLAGLTDGLLRTSKLDGRATEELWVARESISGSQWWLQTIIPGATLVLYVVCIACFVLLNPNQPEGLKELSLTEIISVVAVDSGMLREHLGSGQNVESFIVRRTVARTEVGRCDEEE